VRQERSRPLIIKLQAWFREQRAKLSRSSDTTKAINYCLSRRDAFTRFLDDGRLCMSNDAAERGLRAVAVGRRNWTFAGSDEGADERRRSTPSSPPPYAARGIRRFMPPAELCRTVLERPRRLRALAARRVNIAQRHSA
jgi:Transposase IS66 family